jgi:hypothetical protein
MADTTSASRNTSSDSVRVKVTAPATARVGDSVAIELRVENVSARPVSLSLQGREIAFDLVVTTGDGRTVWSRLQNRTLQSILQLKTLEPGESFVLRDVWRANVEGNYLVSGVVPTDAEPLRSTAPAAVQVGR